MNEAELTSYHVRRHIVLYILGELFFVGIFILLHQVTHVICNVLAHDVLPVDFRVKFFAL